MTPKPSATPRYDLPALQEERYPRRAIMREHERGYQGERPDRPRARAVNAITDEDRRNGAALSWALSAATREFSREHGKDPGKAPYPHPRRW